VRRLPVGFVVIVDHAYVEDLKTNITNSDLRLQTTQVDWCRFREELKQEQPAAKPAVTPRPASDGSDGGAAARAAATEQVPMSLVELAYYGVASLYERYPPKAAPAAEPATADATSN
jgi:hypothetical protein